MSRKSRATLSYASGSPAEIDARNGYVKARLGAGAFRHEVGTDVHEPLRYRRSCVGWWAIFPTLGGGARVLLKRAHALAGRRNRNRLSVPARRRAMFGRCRTTTATAAPAANTITGHGSPMSTETTGSEQAATIDATDA
jgi:hypothetical protein